MLRFFFFLSSFSFICFIHDRGRKFMTNYFLWSTPEMDAKGESCYLSVMLMEGGGEHFEDICFCQHHQQKSERENERK